VEGTFGCALNLDYFQHLWDSLLAWWKAPSGVPSTTPIPFFVYTHFLPPTAERGKAFKSKISAQELEKEMPGWFR